jgi:SAM-dependent methyltransferase
MPNASRCEAPGPSEAYPARSRYQGEVAARYVERRAGSRKWAREQSALQAVVAGLAPGTTILDVPLGTGRFLDFYARAGCRVLGLDISQDMMAVARDADGHESLRALVQGDAASIPLRDRCVDYVVCTRLSNWLPPPVLARAVSEFARIARRGLVIEARVGRRLGPGDLAGRLALEVATRPWKPPQRLWRTLRARWRSRRQADAEEPERRARSERGYVLHSADEMARVFASNGLAVTREVEILHRTDFGSRVLESLRIYVLELPPSRAPASGEAACA